MFPQPTMPTCTFPGWRISSDLGSFEGRGFSMALAQVGDGELKLAVEDRRSLLRMRVVRSAWRILELKRNRPVVADRRERGEERGPVNLAAARAPVRVGVALVV